MRDDGTVDMFQHTAARRRLVADRAEYARDFFVSTHSRPKAAGVADSPEVYFEQVSTHSRPKAAGYGDFTYKSFYLVVSTHSRPKAAGIFPFITKSIFTVSTHSRPKAAG